MKRHPHLVRLSREHHAALRLGRHLLAGGAAAGPGAGHGALVPHLAQGGRGLAPLLGTGGHGALAARLRAEHAHLRSLFATAADGVREAAAGQALIDHVRFEERELFPAIETLFEEVLP